MSEPTPELSSEARDVWDAIDTLPGPSPEARLRMKQRIAEGISRPRQRVLGLPRRGLAVAAFTLLGGTLAFAAAMLSREPIAPEQPMPPVHAVTPAPELVPDAVTTEPPIHEAAKAPRGTAETSGARNVRSPARCAA